MILMKIPKRFGNLRLHRNWRDERVLASKVYSIREVYLYYSEYSLNRAISYN